MPALIYPRRAVSTATTITVNSSALPSWVPAPRQFADASTNNPRVIDDGPGAWSGTQGFGAIWGTWNGAVYAPTLGTYGSMLFFGGGHDGYFGNEIVRYDIQARTWSYQRTRSPVIVDLRFTGDSDSVNVAIDTNGAWSDGTPYPNHTNSAIEFLPSSLGGGTLGSFMFVGHDQSNVNISRRDAWTCDLSTGQWTRHPLSWAGDSMAFLDLFHMTYDSLRGIYWIGGSGIGNLYTIDPSNSFAMTRVTRASGGNFGPGYFLGMEYCAAKDCLVITTRRDVTGALRNENMVVVDLSGYTLGNSTAPAASMIYTGTACPSLWGGQSSGASYQNYMAADRLVDCSQDGNMYALNLYTTGTCTLYKLTPPVGSALTGTWVWTNEVLEAKSGEALALRNLPYSQLDDARLYGKMRYVPAIKSFLLSDSADKKAQALRPSNFT